LAFYGNTVSFKYPLPRVYNALPWNTFFSYFSITFFQEYSFLYTYSQNTQRHKCPLRNDQFITGVMILNSSKIKAPKKKDLAQIMGSGKPTHLFL
jgi:hypothetical protein